MVGYKIGCTTKVMQEFLSSTTPAQEKFRVHRLRGKGRFEFNDFHRIGLELKSPPGFPGSPETGLSMTVERSRVRGALMAGSNWLTTGMMTIPFSDSDPGCR
ncbi:MAG: hypothetical protein Ct9H90mP9_2120 [Pseudomonadota bacterium]|nr:MAG: hypothetical protein Ct9H90mP9_2120 [Pseudomonadota bacterium]